MVVGSKVIPSAPLFIYLGTWRESHLLYPWQIPARPSPPVPSSRRAGTRGLLRAPAGGSAGALRPSAPPSCQRRRSTGEVKAISLKQIPLLPEQGVEQGKNCARP